MTMMSDLPEHLVGEILSRVAIKSLGAVRSTCKRWNALSKKMLICKAEEADKPFLGFMMMDYKLYSMSFNLHGILKEGRFVEPSIKEIGNNLLVNQVEISKVFHSDGLLLCVSRDHTRLVVCNPYLGQTRWIQPRKAYHRLDKYALGHDKNGNHKILRFYDDPEHPLVEYEIYDLKSNSWRVLDLTPYWEIEFYQRGLTLKGNTYFFAKENIVVTEQLRAPETEDFLLCFDFTTERFGQFLPLPFDHYIVDTGTLSYVNEEKLAALHQLSDVCNIEIWVTTMINPNAVSWSSLFKFDMKSILGCSLTFDAGSGCFFIDEEKKTAVIFDIDESERYKTAFIVRENGYLKKVNLGEALVDLDEAPYGRPLVSSYYVPSLVQINQV